MSQRSILRQIIEEFCEVVTRDVARLNHDLASGDAKPDKRMSPEEAEKHFQLVRMLRLESQGLTVKQIAEMEKVSISTVHQIIGGELRSKRKEAKSLRLERYRRLRDSGLTLQQIAELDGISKQAVQQILESGPATCAP